MLIAIVRAVSTSINACALTHRTRQPIDVDVARRQHGAYTAELERLACRVLRLPALDDAPDAVFVEDTVVVVDEVAVMTRPGHPPRRRELPSVEAALAAYRPIERLQPPARLDGGDVIRVGRSVFVGRTPRTNDAGFEQLRSILGPLGYRVHRVDVDGCLHLKSGCTAVGPGQIVVNRRWVDAAALAGGGPLELIDVDAGEPAAANALLVGETVLAPEGCPRTVGVLRERGITVETIDASELAKAEGGLTCCCVPFRRIPV